VFQYLPKEDNAQNLKESTIINNTRKSQLIGGLSLRIYSTIIDTIKSVCRLIMNG
jgi:hypothetical protein